MKAIDRLVVFLVSLFVVLIGVVLILAAFEKEIVLTYVANILDGPSYLGWVMLLVGALIVIIGVVVMVGIAFRSDKRAQPKAVETNVEGGNVQMSVSAINCIVEQAARNINGLGEITTEVHNTPNGVEIRAKVTVNSEVNIPEMANNLQTVIKNQLENMGGLTVASVKVLVVDIASY
ncbi:MAG: alkaline shock response membrane anchor protein AmaP [Clostridia bacterium]|jgi:uncharacterized alkaline shock family protein YloU|nr:alkaline shock response membrane anchor protein AmaP [Clostridia bacterium]